MYLDGARRGVEILVLQFAQRAAIHRVGVIRAEIRHIKVIRTAADFLVRREADAHRAVLRRIGGGQPLAQRHNFRHARLIIRAQHAVAAGDNQLLPLQVLQEREAVDDHAVFERDGAAVVVLDDDGVRRTLHAVGCIHMRNQPDFRRMIALGGNRRVHIAVVVNAGVFDAHCVQLVHQHFCQHPRVRRGRAGAARLAGGRFNLDIPQEIFFDVGHGKPSLYNVDFVDDVDFCRR